MRLMVSEWLSITSGGVTNQQSPLLNNGEACNTNLLEIERVRENSYCIENLFSMLTVILFFSV